MGKIIFINNLKRQKKFGISDEGNIPVVQRKLEDNPDLKEIPDNVVRIFPYKIEEQSGSSNAMKIIKGIGQHTGDIKKVEMKVLRSEDRPVLAVSYIKALNVLENETSGVVERDDDVYAEEKDNVYVEEDM